MNTSRRAMMTAGLGAGLTSVSAASAMAGRSRDRQHRPSIEGGWVALERASASDQSAALQRLIDQHTANGEPVLLPPGRFRVADIQLRSGTKLIGVAGLTEFIDAGGSFFFKATQASNVRLDGITFDGQNRSRKTQTSDANLVFHDCDGLHIDACTVRARQSYGIVMDHCSGRIQNTTIEQIGETGLFTRDSRGLDIVHNDVRACGNNGIQIWRSTPGHDASRVSANRIQGISANSGGSGQYGNGVNVFRADNVCVTDNHISNCAYSAIRGNAASNIQVLGNTCSQIGEVALYAEFAFEGAMIANNLVTDAATGVSVTNFNVGGRLATVTGNLIRNLKRREFEPHDKRGVGISVEADSLVANNVIENAPSAGLALGWGPYRRDLIATQNIIRNAKVGILVSADATAGPTLISGNLISGSTAGAIRKADGDRPVGQDLITDTKALAGVTLSQNIAKPVGS